METRKKIVLVDDDTVELNVLRIRFEVEGYSTITASDGEEGLKKIKQEKPDLVILDLMLPKINGYELCRMLKFDDPYKKIPVIILSGLERQQEREKAVQAGADAYFVKPPDMGLLLFKIKEFLG